MQHSMDQLNKVLNEFLIKNNENWSHEENVKFHCTSIVLHSLIVYLQGNFSVVKVEGFNSEEFFLLGLFEVMERIMREGKTEIVSVLKQLIYHVENGFPPIDDEFEKIDTKMTTKEESEKTLELIFSKPDYDFKKDPDNLLEGKHVAFLTDADFNNGQIHTTQDKT
jgi:hypothetical protein